MCMHFVLQYFLLGSFNFLILFPGVTMWPFHDKFHPALTLQSNCWRQEKSNQYLEQWIQIHISLSCVLFFLAVFSLNMEIRCGELWSHKGSVLLLTLRQPRFPVDQTSPAWKEPCVGDPLCHFSAQSWEMLIIQITFNLLEFITSPECNVW